MSSSPLFSVRLSSRGKPKCSWNKREILSIWNFLPFAEVFTYLFTFFPKTKRTSTVFTRKPDFSIGCPPAKMLKSEKLIHHLPPSPFLGSSQPCLYLVSAEVMPCRPRLLDQGLTGPMGSAHTHPPMHLVGHGTLILCNRNFGKFTSTLGA